MEFRNEEQKQKLAVRNTMQQQWKEKNKMKLDDLEEQYALSLSEFGEAHRSAKNEIEEANALGERKVLLSKLANDRGKKAIHQLAKTLGDSKEKEEEALLRKKKFQLMEKKRASKIAKLPTPTKFKPKKQVIPKPSKKVAFHEAGTFTTSSYLPTSVKVQREEPTEMVNAKSAAKWMMQENKKLEEEKELRRKELEKKTEERGRIARKKEQMKEIYSNLMEDLSEANHDHQLSDFLRGEESLNDEVLVSEAILKSQAMQKQAEKKVEEILSQYEQSNVGLVSGTKSSSSFLGAVDQSVDRVADVILSQEKNGMEDDDDDGKPAKEEEQQGPLSQLNTSAIHFKETVPISELPVVKEKFIVKLVPSSLSTTETSAVESQVESRMETNGKRLTESSVDTTVGSRGESSVDEIMVKITVDQQPSSENSSLTETSGKETRFSSSYETEFADLSNRLKNKLMQTDLLPKEQIKISHQVPEIVPEFSSSSTYLSLPDNLPTRDTDDNDSVWMNLKQIQESRKNIQTIMIKLKEKAQASKQSAEKREFKTFKTPPRIYTEEIKTDESGKRPVSKREKFEEQKKIVLQQYMQRLINMKKEELRQISASSVESSGINLSSEGDWTDLKGKLKVTVDSPLFSSTEAPHRAVVSPVVYNSSSSNYTDIDTLPSKLQSVLVNESHQSQQQVGAATASATSTESRVATSSTDSRVITSSNSTCSSARATAEDINDYEEVRRQQICRRLLELQNLKQQLLLSRGLQHHGRETISENVKNSFQRRDETTLDWSATKTYQTPSREDSTISPRARDSSLTEESLLVPSNHKFNVSKKNGTISDDLHLKADHRTQVILSNNTSKDKQKDLLTLRVADILQSDGPSVESSRSSKSHHSENLLSRLSKSVEKWEGELSNDTKPAIRRSDSRGSAPSSSTSVSSIPDMTVILQKFGLGWAQSMIKKMDIAEENLTSDSSKL